MSGPPERSNGGPDETGGWAAPTDSAVHENYPLANAVEYGAPDEDSVCYVYPADASDAELETRWLAAPACLLVDLTDAR